jgi:hypothetical protein
VNNEGGRTEVLRAASEAIMQLVRDRDEMVAGFTAVLLDLYQVEFQEGRQTKAEVLFRLQVQRDRLAKHSARKGVKVLDSLIQTVEKAQLQPAKPPGGHQLKLRDGHRGQDGSSVNGELTPFKISAPQKPTSSGSAKS